MSQQPIARVRKMCLALPDATERLSHGEPTWFAGKRVFVMFANNHHGDGRVAVWLPAAAGEQARLIEQEPETYFRPPYVGSRGWVGIVLKSVSDSKLSFHIQAAWEQVGGSRTSAGKGQPKRAPRASSAPRKKRPRGSK